MPLHGMHGWMRVRVKSYLEVLPAGFCRSEFHTQLCTIQKAMSLLDTCSYIHFLIVEITLARIQE